MMVTKSTKTIIQSLMTGLTSVLLATTAQAINPTPGWYGGLFLGGSKASNPKFSYVNPATDLVETGKLTHGFYGNIGAQLGYRFFDHYRIEAEILANYNPYKQVRFGSITLNSTKRHTGYYLKGSTTLGAIMVNGLIDIYQRDSESGISPYLGIGIGYARVMNKIKFYENGTVIPGSNISTNSSEPAAQGIAGIGLFADDYTFFGVDFRYLSTDNVKRSNSRLQVASINLLFNGSFCL